MHETFTEHTEPDSAELKNYLQWYGQEPRSFKEFDILLFPELAGWVSVTRFCLDAEGRYEFENTSTIYAGAQVVQVLETDETGKLAQQSDKNSVDRWAPFHWHAIKMNRAVFAETFVHGIGKEFIRYEVGAFPFLNDRGMISHIVLVMSVV